MWPIFLIICCIFYSDILTIFLSNILYTLIQWPIWLSRSVHIQHWWGEWLPLRWQAYWLNNHQLMLHFLIRRSTYWPLLTEFWYPFTQTKYIDHQSCVLHLSNSWGLGRGYMSLKQQSTEGRVWGVSCFLIICCNCKSRVILWCCDTLRSLLYAYSFNVMHSKCLIFSLILLNP